MKLIIAYIQPEQLNEVKILSQPRVLVVQNQEATINLGQQLPIPATDAEGNRTVTFQDVGIKLVVTPQVTNGGHTRTHPILATLPEAAALAEIQNGKSDLEDKLQRELTLFAYPNGKYGRDYREEHAALARRIGFRAAVATDWGTLDTATDPFAIPRFTPWHRNLIRFSVDLARCHYGWL